ncbi:MAG: hypothetical protein QOC95_692, partial [Thermoleophilaceae bacterium]|nr:hypothetical protein [Thermoleophilaceae bacterium]
TAVTKFSMVTEMEAVEIGPGRAVVHARSRPGFTRNRYLCEWSQGLLSQPTVLLGMLPSKVEETECQARGGSKCVYEVHWDAGNAAGALEPEHHITALEAQLAAMAERVESVLATAGDLIAHDDLDTALARITDRAATAVRAPQYLLAVRPSESSDLHCHHRGLTEDEADTVAARLEEDGPHPEGWLVADVSSGLRHYGRLVAINDQSGGFFPQERQLFVGYARFAATVLDRATALSEAQHRRDEAQTMLEMSRALAAASGTAEVAEAIITVVPSIVDCDRVGLFLWHEDAGEFRAPAGNADRLLSLRLRASDSPYLRDMAANPDPQPLYLDRSVDDPVLSRTLEALGDSAVLVLPIAAGGEFLGALSVAVVERPERLRPRPELLDRLSSVVAQAATALQSGRLIDRITHQALHDGLTGLANRDLFGRRREQAVSVAAS